MARYLAADLDRGKLWIAGVLGALGILLAVSAGLADGYFHRGITTGASGNLVLHPTGRELATNADLTIIQPNQLDAVVEQLQIAGFRYVRQPFAWSAIEAQQGTFDWSRYDPVVQSLTERGVTVVAVLQRTPDWARTPGTLGQPDAPPADAATFAAFAAAFVAHYDIDQVPFVQIWDRPNLPEQWGGVGAQPADYARLLTTAATAIEAVEPAVQIVLAEFEPYPRNGINDLDFLRGVYRAGVTDAFDVVAATVDGGGRSPYDRAIQPGRLNLSRAVLFREIMVDEGDAEKPVWATRYGWSAGDGERQVSAERQAAFVIDGIRRARTEWPWMGPMFAWGFLPLPSDTWASYALLTTDGKSTELFGAIGRFARTAGSEAAPTGFVPVDARSLRYQGRWTSQDLPPQVYRTTAALDDSVTFQFRGSGLIAYLRQSSTAGPVRLTLDGEDVGELSAESLQTLQAFNVPIELVSDLDYGVHELTLTLVGEGELTIGGAVVVRDQPFLWPIVLLIISAACILFWAIRDVVYLVATRTGYLRRNRPYDPWRADSRTMTLSPRVHR